MELHLQLFVLNLRAWPGGAAKQAQSHLSDLQALLGAKVEESARNTIARGIVDPHIPIVKTFEELQFEKPPIVHLALIRNLADGDYIRPSEPIIFLGDTEFGKPPTIPSYAYLRFSARRRNGLSRRSRQATLPRRPCHI